MAEDEAELDASHMPDLLWVQQRVPYTVLPDDNGLKSVAVFLLAIEGDRK